MAPCIWHVSNETCSVHGVQATIDMCPFFSEKIVPCTGFGTIFSDMRVPTLQLETAFYLLHPDGFTNVRLCHCNANARVGPSSGTTRRLLCVSNCSATLQFRMAVNHMCHHMQPPRAPLDRIMVCINFRIGPFEPHKWAHKAPHKVPHKGKHRINLRIRYRISIAYEALCGGYAELMRRLMRLWALMRYLMRRIMRSRRKVHQAK